MNPFLASRTRLLFDSAARSIHNSETGKNILSLACFRLVDLLFIWRRLVEQLGNNFTLIYLFPLAFRVWCYLRAVDGSLCVCVGFLFVCFKIFLLF